MITTARVPFLDLNAVNAPLRESLDLALKIVLTHGVFVGGPEVALFESEFAAYCDARAAGQISYVCAALKSRAR